MFFRRARGRYGFYLNEKNREEQRQAKKREQAKIESDLNEAVAKKRKLEEASYKLREEADVNAKKAEKEHNFTFLTKSNSLRDKAKELDKQVPKLEKTIKSLQDLLKS